VKKSILFLSCIVLVTGLYAQTYDADKVKPKALARYENAIQLLKDGLTREAVPVLLECINIDSNFLDAYLSLAGAFGELKQYQRSVNLYEKVQIKDPVYFSIYTLPYSINLAGLGRFEEALKAVNIFLSIPNISERGQKSAAYRKQSYQFAIDYASKHPVTDYQFAPINLGDSVNGPRSEYYPSVTVTDSLLVFTRRTGDQREDFMQSTITNKKFGKAQLIDGDINLEPRKGAITVSQDGEWLLFAGDFSGRGLGWYDIYLNTHHKAGANLKTWVQPSILNFGRALLLSVPINGCSISVVTVRVVMAEEIYTCPSDNPMASGVKPSIWDLLSTLQVMNFHLSFMQTIKHYFILRMDYPVMATQIFLYCAKMKKENGGIRKILATPSTPLKMKVVLRFQQMDSQHTMQVTEVIAGVILICMHFS
jgi:tetratricopeptide (TPR) repeat protein